MRKLVFGLCALVLVSACSTNSVSLSDAKPVSSAFAYSHQQRSSATDATAKIVLDKGYRMGPCRIGVFVDGIRVADLEKGEVATAYLAPGRHILGAGLASDASGWCKAMMADGTRMEREAHFNSSEVRSFRVLRDANAYLDIVPVSR